VTWDIKDGDLENNSVVKMHLIQTCNTYAATTSKLRTTMTLLGVTQQTALVIKILPMIPTFMVNGHQGSLRADTHHCCIYSAGWGIKMLFLNLGF